VVDPMALRDTSTSKVKRVQAAKESGPMATVSLPGTGSPLRKTETVQLKVVQQKKKELDEEMNASSTVRLQAPGSGPSVNVPRPRPLSPPTRDTMKISLPKIDKKGGPSETDSTVAVKPVAVAVPTVRAETAPTVHAEPGQTAKLEAQPVVKTSTQVLEKATAAAAKGTPPPGSTTVTADAVDATVPAGEESTAAGNRTLKLRAGGKAARTLKVKSDGSDKTVAVGEEGDAGDGAATVKVEDAPPAGRSGLKLKGRQQPLGEAPMVAQTMPGREVNSGSPGLLFTLASAATVVALGALTYFLVNQMIAHIL